jgi:hypothetical protein
VSHHQMIRKLIEKAGQVTAARLVIRPEPE